MAKTSSITDSRAYRLLVNLMESPMAPVEAPPMPTTKPHAPAKPQAPSRPAHKPSTPSPWRRKDYSPGEAPRPKGLGVDRANDGTDDEVRVEALALLKDMDLL